jgi:hypothetical protein
MGTMTVLPVLLLKILSILMDFPTFLMGEGLWGVEIKRWWLDPQTGKAAQEDCIMLCSSQTVDRRPISSMMFDDRRIGDRS